MKTLALFLAAGAALLSTDSALAASAAVSWTLPTQYEDGSTLAGADIASTTVEYGTCSGTAFGTKAGQVVATGGASSATVNNLAPGTWCFRAFVTTVAAKGAVSSGFSNVASKTVPFPAPKPPTLVDVILAFLRRVFGWFA